MRLAVELFGVALIASVIGSMVGLGGGFILVPALRLFFGLAPAEAAGTSLALVVANSASGAFTYLLHKRVNVRVGLLLAAGGLPGSILGARLVALISAQTFDWVLAAFLIVVAVDIVWNRKEHARRRPEGSSEGLAGMRAPIALAIGFVVGLVSSLFGIGGGVIVIPSLLYLSDLPAHAIGATSHFAIFLTSPVGLAAHIWQHDIILSDVLPLVAGGLLGGPIGARLSIRLKSAQLLAAVAIALGVAAVSLVVRHL